MDDTENIDFENLEEGAAEEAASAEMSPEDIDAAFESVRHEEGSALPDVLDASFQRVLVDHDAGGDPRGLPRVSPEVLSGHGHHSPVPGHPKTAANGLSTV